MLQYPSAQSILFKARNEVFKSKERDRHSPSKVDLPKQISVNENNIINMFKEFNKDLLPHMNSIVQKERLLKREGTQKDFQQQHTTVKNEIKSYIQMHNLNANFDHANQQIEKLRAKRSEHKQLCDQLSIKCFALQEQVKELQRDQDEVKKETVYFEKQVAENKGMTEELMKRRAELQQEFQNLYDDFYLKLRSESRMARNISQ